MLTVALVVSVHPVRRDTWKDCCSTVEQRESAGRTCPTFRLTDVQGQDRLRPLERLDLRLLVEGKDHGIVRRIQVEPDDIANLVHESRIGRELERARDVRLEPKRPPDTANHGVTHAGLRGHRARTPVRLALGEGFQRLDDHGFDGFVRDRARCADPRFVIQSIEAALNEARAPLPDGRIGGSMPTRHGGIRRRRRAREDESRTKRQRPIDAGSIRQTHTNSRRSSSVTTNTALGRPIVAMSPTDMPSWLLQDNSFPGD